jgi:hypothetical protein
LASYHPVEFAIALRGENFLIGAIGLPFVVVRATLAFLTSLTYHIFAGGTPYNNHLPVLHVGSAGRAKARGQFSVQVISVLLIHPETVRANFEFIMHQYPPTVVFLLYDTPN